MQKSLTGELGLVIHSLFDFLLSLFAGGSQCKSLNPGVCNMHLCHVREVFSGLNNFLYLFSSE